MRYSRQFLWSGVILGLMLNALLSGCAQVAVIGDVLGYENVAQLARGFEDFTPEQEYYIGRTIGARLTSSYPPYDDAKANNYLNLLGQTLAQFSDRPETFAGYRFLILDSDEINAFAAPGGLIFVTRGLLRCCKTEDAVAAVLAHEIGHVQGKDGLRAIKQARITSALTNIAIDQVKQHGDKDLAALTATFEDSIADITTTLVEKGYSRELEYQADVVAVTILQRVGYNPNGLVDMLMVMDATLKPGGLGFAKTHPAPKDRIAEIQKQIGAYSRVEPPVVRQKRFIDALGKV